MGFCRRWALGVFPPGLSENPGLGFPKTWALRTLDNPVTGSPPTSGVLCPSPPNTGWYGRDGGISMAQTCGHHWRQRLFCPSIVGCPSEGGKGPTLPPRYFHAVLGPGGFWAYFTSASSPREEVRVLVADLVEEVQAWAGQLPVASEVVFFRLYLGA